MRSAIFIWAGLLLIGSLSISQGYPESNEGDDENQLNARSDSLIESSESSESKRGEWFNRRSSSCTSACRPSCQSDELCLASGVCTCPGGRGNSPCPTQHHHLCSSSDTAGVKPVVSVTFGEGKKKYSTAKPSELGFSTSYPQTVSGQTNDGFFSIVNEVPQDFGSWLGGGLDHTKNCNAGRNKGYMMLVNAKATAGGEILHIKADNLCLGLGYEFSFYVANINKKGTNIQQPNIQAEVRTGSGTLIASSNTGGVAEQSKLTWVKYGVSFIATSSSVVASLTSTVRGGSGNDFALDDITLVSCSPSNNGKCRR